MFTRFKWFTWPSLALGILLLIALVLRLHGLNAESLSVDESVMLEFTNGLLESGYPHRHLGDLSVPLQNYEFLVYPLALFMGLFGNHETVLRIPAVLFGVATTALIYWIGLQLFNRLTGFLAALIYAFSPWAINFSQCLFHPAQDQFLGLVTIYLWYRGAIESEEIRPAYVYGAAASFPFAYLTWEGHGMLLPVFLLSLFVFRRQDWSWMKSRVLWTGVGIAILVVFLELCWRLASFPPYVQIGLELRHLRSPILAFLLPETDFWVSWKEFFWAENRALSTLLAVVGLPLIRRDRPLAYFYLVAATFPILLTCFLEVVTPHYLYCMLPFLSLVAARVLTTYLGSVSKLLPGDSPIGGRLINYSLILVIVAGVFLSSNYLALRLYRLSYMPDKEGYYEREDYAWIDHRGGGQFMAQQAATPITSNMACYLKQFQGIISSYCPELNLGVPVYYDYVSANPKTLEKYIGAPVLRNYQELEEAFCQNRRLYLEVTTRLSRIDPMLVDFLYSRCHPVFHTFNDQVFLWNNAGRSME